MSRKKATDFHPRVLKLFDQYVHGGINRREFLDQAAPFAVGGTTAAAIFASLSPNYAWGQQVPEGDSRIQRRGTASARLEDAALAPSRIEYESPKGHGSIKALLVRPAGATGKLPGVLVIHENRGLNPYIEDVARRAGAAGFLALAPDGLTMGRRAGIPETMTTGGGCSASLTARNCSRTLWPPSATFNHTAIARARWVVSGSVSAEGSRTLWRCACRTWRRRFRSMAGRPRWRMSPRLTLLYCCTMQDWMSESMRGGRLMRRRSRRTGSGIRLTFIRRRTTVFTTIRLHVMTRRRPS